MLNKNEPIIKFNVEIRMVAKNGFESARLLTDGTSREKFVSWVAETAFKPGLRRESVAGVLERLRAGVDDRKVSNYRGSLAVMR